MKSEKKSERARIVKKITYISLMIVFGFLGAFTVHKKYDINCLVCTILMLVFTLIGVNIAKFFDKKSRKKTSDTI